MIESTDFQAIVDDSPHTVVETYPPVTEHACLRDKLVRNVPFIDRQLQLIHFGYMSRILTDREHRILYRLMDLSKEFNDEVLKRINDGAD